ncbi:MAG TPA: DUF2357 domain-containing protein [Gemmatimonadaceae bacterium]|nr:DUF2357 domain-containing protein [Gemmatimonadaceae bacterium]
MRAPHGPLSSDHPDLFVADDATGRTGRLRPGQRVGLLKAAFREGARPLGSIAVEVRARRLDYVTEFRWMLRDIVDVSADMLLEGFAPTSQRFSVDPRTNSHTAYQRFAFLQSMLRDERLTAALELICKRPHISWQREPELRRSSQGIATSSRLCRSISRPGPRVVSPHGFRGIIKNVPREIVVDRTVETIDNPPNQFARFVLLRWRDTVSEVLGVLNAAERTAASSRGVRECNDLLSRIQGYLARAPFSGASRLARLPIENPVLTRKEGYRDLTRAFFQSELAGRLAWQGGEDVYSAGQRNVATLYEYWVYLQMARALSDACDVPISLSKLVRRTPFGSELCLAQGSESRVEGTVTRGGRRLRLVLWFNRTFARGSQSWTRTMRPDCSLHVRVGDEPEDDFRGVWLHFDAKYRAEALSDVLASVDEDVRVDSTARRDDLLKMHAYRDAIRRSAGAYVIYPGSEDREYREYHELLPGLGAFRLRPTASGDALGVKSVKRFIADVLNHVAAQVSQHERDRYWRHVSYNELPSRSSYGAMPADFLTAPPADTVVLLGYVKSPAHFVWIRQEGLYNVRADGRVGSVAFGSKELQSAYVLLYSSETQPPCLWRVNGVRIMLKSDMDALAYPDPRGASYFCYEIASLPAPSVDALSFEAIVRLRQQLRPGAASYAPVAVSWLDLAGIISTDSGVS